MMLKPNFRILAVAIASLSLSTLFNACSDNEPVEKGKVITTATTEREVIYFSLDGETLLTGVIENGILLDRLTVVNPTDGQKKSADGIPPHAKYRAFDGPDAMERAAAFSEQQMKNGKSVSGGIRRDGNGNPIGYGVFYW